MRQIPKKVVTLYPQKEEEPNKQKMSLIRKKLKASPSYILAIYASLFLFVTYTCTYAYRKPFSAGIYAGETAFGFDAKLLYVLAQIIGYACSKFIGVRILPGMKKNQRALYTIGLMTFSEIMLIGFGLFPNYIKVFMILLSGLPLGMIWGILFSYIEGRKISEILNVGISVTLIVSSGIVKSLGQFTMDTFHLSEYWMPAATGALCFPIMVFSAWMMDQIPEPSKEDIIARTERVPMSKSECKQFLKRFFTGIVLLVIFYGFLTVFRELRDSFAADFWKELNMEGAMIFTKTELPICILILGIMFTVTFIKSNRWAVNFIYGVSMVGGFIMVVSTFLYTHGMISPVWWMILSGLGMYMGYIPFSFLIDRLIALLRVISTMVFLLYLADSVGYLGTTIVFLVKNFAEVNISWSNMLVYMAYITGASSIILIYFILTYFRKQIIRIINEENLIKEEKINSND